MTEKVNGTSTAGEFFNRDLDFFTVSSTAVLASDGAVGDAAQDLFDQHVEVISQKAQPIILTSVSGTGPYVFSFAVEHPGLWTEAGATDPKAESLKDVLEALPGAGTVTVTYSTTFAS